MCNPNVFLKSRIVVQLGVICYVWTTSSSSAATTTGSTAAATTRTSLSTSTLLQLSSSSASVVSTSSFLSASFTSSRFSDHFPLQNKLGQGLDGSNASTYKHRQHLSTSTTASSTSVSSRSLSSSPDNGIDQNRSLASSYHLVWNHGFGKKFALTTVSLATIHRLIVLVRTTATITTTTSTASTAATRILLSGFVPSMGLSLLASSCCLIQIIANVLVGTVGCLGLNTALGPYRPYFLSLLFYLTVMTKSVRSSPSQLLPRLGVAFLPEVLHFWNNHGRNTIGQFTAKQTHLPHPMTSTTISSTSNNILVATIDLDVPAMGCVACINKIDRTIQNEIHDILKTNSPSVTQNSQEEEDDTKFGQGVPVGNKNVGVDVSSWLDPQLPKGGSTRVMVHVKSKEEAQSIGQTLLESLERNGFGGSTISKLEVS